MNHVARKEVVKGDYANAAALAKRYGVDQSTIHKRVKNFLKKSKKASSEIFRRDGWMTMFDVRKTDKIFGYKDVVTQDDLFADRAEVDAAAKRIAANVPTVGDILREEETKGDKKVYQPTYDDFFEWCGRTGDYPKKVFDDYVKTCNLGTASQSLIAGRVLCDTLRRIRAEYFDMVKDFLLTAVGKEKPSRADLYRQRALRMRFNAMLDPEKGGAK